MSPPHGYAGRILRVDLSSRLISQSPTSDYSAFLGGRGMAARIHWDDVPPDVNAFHPENRLAFFTGPLCGFPGLASSRWTVCGKSPATKPEHVCYSNLGGTWGMALKSAGYDGVIIHGQSEKPVYLLITPDGAQILDASHLWGSGAIQARDQIKSQHGWQVNVVTCGQAGENLAVMASILADRDSSGSSGFGAVMGAKRLKAVAVMKGGIRPTAAQPDTLHDLVGYYRHLQGQSNRDYFAIAGKTKLDPCWGCPGLCGRISWKAEDGTEGKFFCQSALLYQIRAQQFYGQGRDSDVPFKVTRLCDDYGLDTMAVHVIMSWLSRCYRDGLVTEEQTGLPLGRTGSLEYAEALVRTIALREGFGDLLAQGVEYAAEKLGEKARNKIGDLMNRAHQPDQYGARTYLTNGLFYATEVRMPIQHLHRISIPVLQWLGWLQGLEGAYISDRVLSQVAARFFGGEAAADFSTWQGKALAAKMIQDRQYAAECLILCDYGWPVMTSPHTDDHVGDSSLESRVLSAVIGEQIDEATLLRFGEKVFNLQRAILTREGHLGRSSDTLPEYNFTSPLKYDVLNSEMLVPGPGGKPVSFRGKTVDKLEFEAAKDEYYRLRGWDVTSGRQTGEILRLLDLPEVARQLEARHLLS